jgi:monoamine oxidase
VARTPLFRTLRRSFRLARFANRSPHAFDDAGGAAAVPAVSRRAFLGAVGAAAAAPLAGCVSLPRLGRRASDPQVVIVGAGLAGLTAAWRLRQAGVDALVVEAQDRVGGRCFSLRGHFAHGQVAELGGELIDSGHTHVRELAEELRIPLDDLAADEPSLDHEVWFFDGRRYSEREVVEAFRPVAPRIAADLAVIGGDDISYRTPGQARRLDAMTIDEWLDAAGVEGWFRRLIEVAYTAEYGLETGEQSALNLLLLISAEADPFRVYGESDERYHVRGGNDRLAQALAGRIGRSVETGTMLEAVRARADGALELSLRSGTRSRVVSAPHVILALPFTLLRAVAINVALPDAKRRAIAELRYGTNAKLMMGFDGRPWRTDGRSNGSVLTDLELQCTWETSRGQEGPGGILTNFTGGRQGIAVGEGLPPEQALRVVGDLERIFPRLANARIPGRDVRFHWPSHAWTQGSYACYGPGQWTTIHGAEGERVGNLLFAGEHCSRHARGFLEGAVESGDTAAREVLTDLRTHLRLSVRAHLRPTVRIS